MARLEIFFNLSIHLVRICLVSVIYPTFIKIDGKSYRSNHADLDDEDGFSKIKKEEKESIH
ncbi:MAG: hypothetical protein FADNKDHG_01105 [Holosporales bacterium]